ncbi:MAG: hypothetical protein KDA22_03895 [Phycisphaerales bacterium]|nr:hypothetical protein [Phycisphaerales bacterium]
MLHHPLRARRTVAAMALVLAPAASAGLVTSTYVGSSGGNWNVAGNWNPATVPNNGGGSVYDVVVNGDDGTDVLVVLNIDALINTLRIDAGDVLSMSVSGAMLTVEGGLVDVDGEIRLADAGGSVVELAFSGNTLLTGSGSVVFASNDDNWLVSVTPESVVTVGPDVLVTTTSATLFENSLFRAAAVNQGVIEANEGQLELNINDKTNLALIRAVNGGSMEIEGITLTNTGGTLEADPDSTFILDGADIVGGTLTGGGTFDVTNVGGRLDGSGAEPVTIGTGTTVLANASGDDIFLRGSIVNDGVLRVQDLGSGSAQILIEDDVTLDGAGVVLLAGPDDSLVNSADPAFVLVVGADQTITCTPDAALDNSLVRAAIENHGLVEANIGSFELNTNDKTNLALIRASNGGTLEIEGITLTNTGGTLEADADSAFLLDGAEIVGGSLAGDGVFDTTTSDVILDGSGTEPVTIGSGATVRANASGEAITLVAPVVNHGTIEISDAGSSSAQLRFDAAGGAFPLDGTGTVTFGGAEDDNDLVGVGGTTLVVGQEQTILATDGKIGRINLATSNTGTIRANGEIRIVGVPLANVDTGVVTGSGVLRVVTGGTLANESGTVAPGDAIGTLTVDGACQLAANGDTVVELGGLADGEYDRLSVTGAATVGGRLVVALDDGFLPEAGDMFVVVTGNPVIGTFDCRDLPATRDLYWRVVATSSTVTLVATNVPTSPADLNADGFVDGTDLGLLLGAWGDCVAADCCFGDLSGDGSVGGADLGLLLGDWTTRGR